MEKRGLLSADWKTNESGHEAKYYKITRRGRQVLAAETESWERLVDAIGLILRGEARS
jgi:DNA-binding PadR family transcriptional regulator